MSEYRSNAHCTLPDDAEQSTYRYIIVAAKRARQLQGGSRPLLPTTAKKATVIATEEARRGLVKYYIPGVTDVDLDLDAEATIEESLS